MTVGAQTFDDDFDDRTLRLDYVLAGNSREQHIYFNEAIQMPRWAGRKARLTEAPLRGNGQIALTDHATGRLLYVHTFSTLFQEWQVTNEADMLPKGTTIPTPPAKIPYYKDIKNEEERRQLNAATQRVGVFEGGGYQLKGVYRPAQECRMKINEVEHFCPVCSRALVRITDFYTSTTE